MNRTYASEDDRKTKLFESWNAHLKKIHEQFSDHNFEQLYEGTATVSELSTNFMGLHLDDGRKLRYISISPEIKEHSSRLDLIYLLIGQRDGRWWPLEVTSIGSVVEYMSGKVHFTFNPELMAN